MKKPLGYTRSAYKAVKEAIEAAGTTTLPNVSFALEELISEKLKNRTCLNGKNGFLEKTFMYRIYHWLDMVGIYTTGDLQRIINQVVINQMGAMK